jgi:hypothetical protein
MLRLEDPAEAFRARPYDGADALLLEVATIDPLQEEKAVRFKTELRGAVAPEGKPIAAALACGLGTLARLWAAALTVREACDLGLADISPPTAIEPLDRLLRAPSPWIVERF